VNYSGGFVPLGFMLKKLVGSKDQDTGLILILYPGVAQTTLTKNWFLGE
jgi:hypothetical protein